VFVVTADWLLMMAGSLTAAEALPETLTCDDWDGFVFASDDDIVFLSGG